jgi:hypothetical protein
LTEQIEALEAQIKELDTKLQPDSDQPRLRSTALPQAAIMRNAGPAASASSRIPEPVFEDVDVDRLQKPGETGNTPAHYNELGVRKYDLTALFRRVRTHFRGPSASNPRLVSYLAAGGIQGLRPLRYEKRVARNRFIVFVIFLFLMLLGLVAAFYRHR